MTSEHKKPRVLITGASRGIGRAIARTFAKEGWCLYLVCEKQFALLQGLWEELLEDNIPITENDFYCFCTDLSDPAAVDALFDRLPPLDLVIHNAGISFTGLLTEMTVEEWRRVLSVNLDSAFYISKKAVPSMIHRRNGRMIFISSVWGSTGASMEVAYSASKGGLNSFTKALARELAPSRIPVNAIACGFIDTRMNNHLSPEEKAALLEEIPAGRAGTPEEVARTALFLASAPDYLTGQILTLDGGWT